MKEPTGLREELKRGKKHGVRFLGSKRRVTKRTHLSKKNGVGDRNWNDEAAVTIQINKARRGDSGAARLRSEIHLPAPLKAVMKFGKKNLQTAKTYKTKIGNRKVLLYEIDERDHRVRRAKELYFGVLKDLGGADHVTILQDMTAKLLSFMYVMAEHELVKYIKNDDDFNVIIYMAIVKVAGQQAKSLGLKRIKQLSPGDEPKDLDEYLKQQERKFRHMKEVGKSKTVDANYEVVERVYEGRNKKHKRKRK